MTLDLPDHVFRGDLDVRRLDPGKFGDFGSFFGEDGLEVGRGDQFAGVLVMSQPRASLGAHQVSSGEGEIAVRGQLTVLDPYLHHCHNCTRAISAVAASSCALVPRSAPIRLRDMNHSPSRS